VETRTAGAEGGPGKRAGSNPGTALRPDPYYPVKAWVNGQYAETAAMPRGADAPAAAYRLGRR
jgi:hypothetical protein